MLQLLILILLRAGELPVSVVCGCFGISLVTVTYFSVLIESVLASETYWRLAVM